MKLPPYTLVYRPGTGGAGDKERRRLQIEALGAHDEDLAQSLGALKPALRRSLLRTVESSANLALSARAVSRAAEEMVRHPKVESVGLWDLSSQVGGLPRVVEALNRAQPVFAFFEVQAAVPSGLVSRPERVRAWAEDLLHRPLTDNERATVNSCAIFEEWEERAGKVRKGIGVDHLIGIVPALVASGEAEEVQWDLFSAGRGGLSLISTVDLYAYARQAKRSFEVAAGMLAVSTLLATTNPKLEFHAETRGCLFDFDDERSHLVQGLRRLAIEPSCLEKLRPRYREAALAMVEALRGEAKP